MIDPHAIRQTRETAAEDAADIELLAQLWQLWLSSCQELAPTTWTASSAIGSWTVRELVGHVASRGPLMVSELLDSASAAAPEITTAQEYFRTVAAIPSGAEGVAQRAVDYAATVSDKELTDAFADANGDLRKRMHAAASASVQTPAGSIRLADYLQTRIVEACVHLIDLSRGAGWSTPAIPDLALRRAVNVLTELVPAVDLLDLATGRTDRNPFPVLT